MRKSISNYLKTIYEAGYAHDGTNNKQIATLLDVLPGSVTEAISNLVKMGLVTRKTYHEITLTSAGFQLVKDLMFRYRLCEVWLAETIKLPLESVPAQAWLMAAIDDQVLLQRLNEQLDEPQVSPFGGALRLQESGVRGQRKIKALNQVVVGSTVTLVSYLETDSMVQYLQHVHLELNQQLTVTNQSVTLPMMTLVGPNEEEYMLDMAVAQYLYVQPVRKLARVGEKSSRR